MENFLSKCIPLLENYDGFDEIFERVIERKDEILTVLKKHLADTTKSAVEEQQETSASKEEQNRKDHGDFFPIQWLEVGDKVRRQTLLAIHDENKYVLNQAYARLMCLMERSTQKFLGRLTKYQKAVEHYIKKYYPDVLVPCSIEDVLVITAKAFSHLYYIEFARDTNYPNFALEEYGFEVKDEVFREAFINQIFTINSYCNYVEECVEEFLKDERVFMKYAFKLHDNMFGQNRALSFEQLKEEFQAIRIDKRAFYPRMIGEYIDLQAFTFAKMYTSDEEQETNEDLEKFKQFVKPADLIESKESMKADESCKIEPKQMTKFEYIKMDVLKKRYRY